MMKQMCSPTCSQRTNPVTTDLPYDVHSLGICLMRFSAPIRHIGVDSFVLALLPALL